MVNIIIPINIVTWGTVENYSLQLRLRGAISTATFFARSTYFTFKKLKIKPI